MEIFISRLSTMEKPDLHFSKMEKSVLITLLNLHCILVPFKLDRRLLMMFLQNANGETFNHPHRQPPFF